MTREEARKAAEVMLAYAEGKEVESKRRIFSNDSWCEIKDGEPVFNWQNCDYRIKKEPKLEIIYRPFKNKEECWNEMQKHQPFGWVKDKDNKAYIDIEMIGGDSDDCGINDTEYPRIFNEFNFADGTPFGIKEE